MTQGTPKLESILELVPLAAREGDDLTLSALFLARVLEVGPACDAGSVWLYLPDAAELSLRASTGYKAELLRQIRLPAGKSVGRPFSTGQSTRFATPAEAAACIAELTDSQRALYRTAAGVESPHSIIVAPLHVGDTKLGVFVLEHLRRARRFSAADLKWLQSAADLLALALVRARLKQALRQAQAANQVHSNKAESISFLAHEMRTPLTTIKGYATALLMEDTDFDAAAQREFLGQIDQECDTLIRLIEDLLESSVLEGGMLQLEREPVRVPRLVRELVDDLRFTTTQHRFLLEFPSEFPLVEADPLRLAQVLRNLLENAVKYSSQGGLIVIHGEIQSNQVLISVADQGVGIAPEHLNRLFEKFFRVKSGATPATTGSGLGLPIARSLVEAHGGQIWAESRLGEGSTFYFSLPLARLDQEPKPEQASNNE
jgi:signal transduction histidine kinase